MQLVAPTVAYRPTVQSVQLDDAEAPVAVEYAPAAQFVQLAALASVP